jgi:hypothetical protein
LTVKASRILMHLSIVLPHKSYYLARDLEIIGLDSRLRVVRNKYACLFD